jgi:ABC-type xylose transport system permease subunit
MNGLVITQARVQPFIATLVMNMASRGVQLFLTADQSLRIARSAVGLRWLGRGWVGPFPVPILVLLAAMDSRDWRWPTRPAGDAFSLPATMRKQEWPNHPGLTIAAYGA